MGKQINYWMGYEDFQRVAQTALDCGCVIVKPVGGIMQYGQTLDIVTAEEKRYYFHVPAAGELVPILLPSGKERVGGFNATGNVVIEASYSYRDDEKKELIRSRLYVTTGYYGEDKDFAPRPEELTKVYNKLVRVVKKVAPYTELVDTYISRYDGQEKEWRRKEYISPEFLRLKLDEGYTLHG